MAEKKRILVLKDVCTGFIMRSLNKFDSERVVETLIEIFSFFGVPQVIKSDSGSEFGSKLVKSLCDQLKIFKLVGTPHHQNSNEEISHAGRVGI